MSPSYTFACSIQQEGTPKTPELIGSAEGAIVSLPIGKCQTSIAGCKAIGLEYFWHLWHPTIGSLGPGRKIKVSVCNIPGATPTQYNKGYSKEFTLKVFVGLDRTEDTQKMQGYLTLHIFECFAMSMEDIWIAHAQSQTLNFTHYKNSKEETNL